MQYTPTFLSYRPILSATDKDLFDSLSSRYLLQEFLQNSRNFEETAIDFVYTSAKIEGNAYDRLDAEILLKFGITAGGKRLSDAIMLVNLHKGFTQVMATEKSTSLDFNYLCNLHKGLMKDLLPSYEQGFVRTSGVQIGASSYTPLEYPNRLRTEAKFLLSEANKYENPFERAIYLHCNIAYLQAFRDGNKRTARMMQTAAMVQSNVLPLFFSATLIKQYLQATLNYYETGKFDDYVHFFKQNYQLSIEKITGRN